MNGQGERYLFHFRPVTANKRLVPAAEGRYELDTASATGAYNLRISNVSYADDNGVFFCQLMDKRGETVDAAAQVVVLGELGVVRLGKLR
jgi:hypothetical protein